MPEHTPHRNPSHPHDPARHTDPTGPAALTDHDQGRWQITTQTSLYLLDLTRRTLVRIPGTLDRGLTPTPAGVIWVVTRLPIDLRPQRLLRLTRCQIGHDLLARIRGADGATSLRSTPIRDIRPLPPARTPGRSHD